MRGRPVWGLLLVAAEVCAAGEGQAISSRQSSSDCAYTCRSEGQWCVTETENFSIWTKASAQQTLSLAQRCEDCREVLAAQWLDQKNAALWTPKCVIVLHRDLGQYQQALDQPGDMSVGCTSLDFDSGRVVFRRVDLRADADGWAASTLPHELTHVVLADRFPEVRLPRWADEGSAMLAEAPAARERWSKTLDRLQDGRRLLPTRSLITMSRHPSASERDAFYAQSSTLVEFLVTQGNGSQFIDFVDRSLDVGYDEALRSSYDIDGVADLERRWSQWSDSQDRAVVQTGRTDGRD